MHEDGSARGGEYMRRGVHEEGSTRGWDTLSLGGPQGRMGCPEAETIKGIGARLRESEHAELAKNGRDTPRKKCTKIRTRRGGLGDTEGEARLHPASRHFRAHSVHSALAPPDYVSTRHMSHSSPERQKGVAG